MESCDFNTDVDPVTKMRNWYFICHVDRFFLFPKVWESRCHMYPEKNGWLYVWIFWGSDLSSSWKPDFDYIHRISMFFDNSVTKHSISWLKISRNTSQKMYS